MLEKRLLGRTMIARLAFILFLTCIYFVVVILLLNYDLPARLEIQFCGGCHAFEVNGQISRDFSLLGRNFSHL
jgi:hypothetical protein